MNLSTKMFPCPIRLQDTLIIIILKILVLKILHVNSYQWKMASNTRDLRNIANISWGDLQGKKATLKKIKIHAKSINTEYF